MHLLKAFGVLILAALAVGAATGISGARGYSAPGGAGSKPTLTITVLKKQTTRSVRGKGLKVRARCSAACKVSLRLVKGTRIVGAGSKSLPSRAGIVRVKVGRSTKRSLKRARRASFTLVGGALNASNQTSNAVTKIVRLKRR